MSPWNVRFCRNARSLNRPGESGDSGFLQGCLGEALIVTVVLARHRAGDGE
jgi:hypothetical protein